MRDILVKNLELSAILLTIWQLMAFI